MFLDMRKCRNCVSGVKLNDNIYMFNVSMSFKGPLPECTYYQFLKLFIFYCTVNAMMICVVVDMEKWCYCMLIDIFYLAVGFLILRKQVLFLSTISPISNGNMNNAFRS